MDSRDIYNNSNCFTDFKNNLFKVVETYYFGLACKLRGEGKLLTIFSRLIEYLISYGKVAVVSYGGYLILAQIVEGHLTQTGWKHLKVLFFGDEKGQEFTPAEGSCVIFQWGKGNPLNFDNLNHEILEMWHIKSLIGWDQDKSKKRMFVEFEKDPGKDGWKEPMNSYESGFIGIIAPGKITNQIKKWEYFTPRADDERQKLRQDLKDVESNFYYRLGIRHNPFAKEERQNNPEVMSGQAYFDAWEIRHSEGIVKGILDFQEKPWGGGSYNLQFGSLPTLLIENQTTQYLAQQNTIQPSFNNNIESKTNNLPSQDNSSHLEDNKKLRRELEEIKRKIGLDY